MQRGGSTHLCPLSCREYDLAFAFEARPDHNAAWELAVQQRASPAVQYINKGAPHSLCCPPYCNPEPLTRAEQAVGKPLAADIVEQCTARHSMCITAPAACLFYEVRV
jgi:hypothetical protein